MTYDRVSRPGSEPNLGRTGPGYPDRACRAGWINRAAIAAAGIALLAAPAPTRAEEPELDRLRAHVETLASPEFAGRRDAGGVRARDYVLGELKKFGLAPLFGGSYTQDIPGREPGEVAGTNVGVAIPGSDPALRDQWVILGVHFDHLGTRGDTYYPGADDNASGVAMMLEVARAVAASPEKPRRSIAFVGFDLEEVGARGEFGLRGSRHFAAHPPMPIEQVRLFVTADMLGRSLAGVCGPTVFVLGSEHAPGVRPWIDQSARDHAGPAARLAVMGADLLVIDRSDYGPFRSRSVPFLFFTTGESPVYHTPADVATTLDYPKLEAASRMIGGVVRRAVGADAVPAWTATPDNPVAEAVAIGAVLRTLLDHQADLRIPAPQAFLIRNTLRTIDGVAARGAITPAERAGIVRVAQVVLFTVL